MRPTGPILFFALMIVGATWALAGNDPPSSDGAFSRDQSVSETRPRPGELADNQAKSRQLRRRPRGPLPDWALRSWFIRRQLEPVWVLRGANVVDVQNGGVAKNVNIVIAGDLIRSVGRDEPPAGVKIVDVSGQYVVPGFFDLHAHVIPKWRAFPTATEPEETLKTLLHAGVTTIRAIPLYSESALTWSARVNDGTLIGPTIVPTSSIFEKEPQRTSRGFGDPQTVRGWVRKEALLGSRWIKIYDSMDEDSLRAIVDTAREYGMKVCGHASRVPPHRASAIGLATVEHVLGIGYSCLPDGVSPPSELGSGLAAAAWYWDQLDERKCAELLETFKTNRTGWVPTLVVLERILELGGHDGKPIADPRTLERLRAALHRSAELAVRLHRMGGLTGVGTDFPVDTVSAGESVHRELELLVSLGQATPLEALQIGTLSSARILGFEALLGTVEAGKIANLVVLSDDPLKNISNVRSVTLVVHDGKVHHPQ